MTCHEGACPHWQGRGCVCAGLDLTPEPYDTDNETETDDE